MNSNRIKQIQSQTAYPQSQSVKQALLQVWNECEQENENKIKELSEFLETVYKSLATYGKHPIIDEQYRKLKAKQLLKNKTDLNNG